MKLPDMLKLGEKYIKDYEEGDDIELKEDGGDDDEEEGDGEDEEEEEDYGDEEDEILTGMDDIERAPRTLDDEMI